MSGDTIAVSGSQRVRCELSTGRSMTRHMESLEIEPSFRRKRSPAPVLHRAPCNCHRAHRTGRRSEEHTSELQSLMRISYAVFCLKNKNQAPVTQYNSNQTRK